MDVQINVLAVILAAALSVVATAIWYAKPVFGGTWTELVGLDEKKQKKGETMAMLTSLIASLIAAYVIAQFTFLANRYIAPQYDYWMTDALQVAFWLWLGISATTIVTHHAFEQRRARFTALAIGNQFVCIMVMGAVIGLLKP